MKHPSSGELKLGGWASEVPWASFLQLPPMTISISRRLTPSIQTVPNHFVISGTQRATSWQMPHWVVIKTRIARLSLMITGSAQVFGHPRSSRNRRVYLKHCHQCKCHPFSQVLMLAIVLNWAEANIYKEIFVFVTLSGLVVTVQQNSQEITMKLQHYVHNDYRSTDLQIWKRILHNLWIFYYIFLRVEAQVSLYSFHLWVGNKPSDKERHRSSLPVITEWESPLFQF